MSAVEELLLFQIRALRLPEPEREVVLCPPRRFRWDFVWREYRVSAEVEGGTWSRGRSGHSSGAGIRRDCVKQNLATLAGYRTLRYTTDMVESGEAVQDIRAVMLAIKAVREGEE